MEWDVMKKTIVLIVIMVLSGATWWVSAAEKALVEGTGTMNVNDFDWLDANDYDAGDKLMAVPHVPVGSRVAGGFVPGENWVEGAVTIILDHEAVTWSLDDANSLWGWEFIAPNEPGIYYARFQARVTEPYNAGSEYWTLAFEVVPQVYLNLRWWYQYL